DRLMREYSEKSAHVARIQSDLVRMVKSKVIDNSSKNSFDIEQEIIELEKHLNWQNFLLPRWRELSGQGLGQVRQVQRLLCDVEQLQQIRLKMLQSLRDLPQESI